MTTAAATTDPKTTDAAAPPKGTPAAAAPPPADDAKAKGQEQQAAGDKGKFDEEKSLLGKSKEAPKDDKGQKADPTPEEKAAAEKAKTDEAAKTKAEADKAKAEEKFELALAKDSLVDPKEAEAFAAFAKEKGLTKEQAQLLIDREAGARKTYVDGQIAKFQAQHVEWGKQIEADTEVGGAKLKESNELATRFIERFGEAGFVEELKESGFARHPKLFKLLARAGRAMAEDKLVNGQTTEPPKPSGGLEDMYKTKK